jgi:GDPmannose 4,6-dehydratase
MTTALICGISGQDGGYLARHLLSKGYHVWGTSRDAQIANFSNLRRLNVGKNIELLSMAPGDFRSMLSTIAKAQPDEIYYLAGQTSVGLSFDQPVETMESIANSTLNLLEAVRFLGISPRIYHASSSEVFGNVPPKCQASETTPFHPRSPYGVAKASAHWLINNYREAYGLHCSNGILFNHESPLRPARFVTKKIVAAACRIKSGSSEKLQLGRLDIARDWGWAPDFVDAMWRILQVASAGDYVIATGVAHTLEQFTAEVFGQLGLEWRDHVESDPALKRPSDIAHSVGDPTKARQKLGWSSGTNFSDLISLLIEGEQEDVLR